MQVIGHNGKRVVFYAILQKKRFFLLLYILKNRKKYYPQTFQSVRDFGISFPTKRSQDTAKMLKVLIFKIGGIKIRRHGTVLQVTLTDGRFVMQNDFKYDNFR